MRLFLLWTMVRVSLSLANRIMDHAEPREIGPTYPALLRTPTCGDLTRASHAHARQGRP
jgi:hypothetical protein